MHWLINYENKTNKCYEDMRIYYIVDVVSLLHVSATYCENDHNRFIE